MSMTINYLLFKKPCQNVHRAKGSFKGTKKDINVTRKAHTDCFKVETGINPRKQWDSHQVTVRRVIVSDVTVALIGCDKTFIIMFKPSITNPHSVKKQKPPIFTQLHSPLLPAYQHSSQTMQSLSPPPPIPIHHHSSSISRK